MIFHYIKYLYNFFDRQFPTEHKIFTNQVTNLFVNASYNCIYYFSKFQIFYMNAKNNLNLFIEINPVLSKIRDEINNIIFKKNESRFVIQYVNNGTTYDKPIEEFDFIINSLLIKDTIMRRLFYKKYEIDNSFLESNIKFILIEFKIGENTYKIDLTLDHFNYYLVGNKFTKEFFIFYIKNHLHIHSKINNNDDCNIKIIDHDVNSIQVDFTEKNESIILDKTCYRIDITNHPNNE